MLGVLLTVRVILKQLQSAICISAVCHFIAFMVTTSDVTGIERARVACMQLAFKVWRGLPMLYLSSTSVSLSQRQWWCLAGGCVATSHDGTAATCGAV